MYEHMSRIKLMGKSPQENAAEYFDDTSVKIILGIAFCRHAKKKNITWANVNIDLSTFSLCKSYGIYLLNIFLAGFYQVPTMAVGYWS